MGPLRQRARGGARTFIVGLAVVLFMTSIEMVSGVPSAAAGSGTRSSLPPAYVLTELPPGFERAKPTLTIERNVGAGWSDLDQPGWTYAGQSAAGIIAATNAKRLRSVVLRGVRGTLYRIDPDAFGRLLTSKTMRQFPRWVDRAYMFVASNRHAALAYVLGGVDARTFVESTDAPPPNTDPNAPVVVRADARPIGSDRLVRGIRIDGQPGCSTDCGQQGWMELLQRPYRDRIRVTYRARVEGKRRFISVTGFAEPCAAEPAKDPLSAGAIAVFGSTASVVTRTITIGGLPVEVRTISPPDQGGPRSGGTGGPEPVPQAKSSPQLFACVPEAGGASVDIWSDATALPDPALVALANGVERVDGAARAQLAAGASVSDDLQHERPTKGIAGREIPLVRTVTRPPLRVPDPLPEAKPGTVISDRRVRGTGDSGFTVHRVLYHSRDRRGRDVATGATVVVPDGPARRRPVVVAGHGTAPMVDGCSETIEEPTDLSIHEQQQKNLLRAGVIIVTPDYIGNGGTPGVHTYLDVAELGHAMLDGARAARKFGGTGPVGFIGYSEGASASLAAGGFAKEYAPELDVRAVTGSSLTSLYAAAFAAARAVTLAGAYQSEILVGLLAAHPELDPHDVLNEHGLEVLAAIRRFERSQICPANHPELASDDFKVDPATLPAWRDAIEANYPDRLEIGAPVLLTHYDNEALHPIELAEDACRGLAASGIDIRLWRYATAVDSQDIEDMFDRNQWILDRFRGKLLAEPIDWHGAAPTIGAPC